MTSSLRQAQNLTSTSVITSDVELRHNRCVCSNEADYKGGKDTTSLLATVLVKQHVSAYCEAIFRFTDVS